MKKQKEPNWCWHVRGFDSTTEIFDQIILVGQITVSNLKELLRVLAARHLSPRELVGAYATKNTKAYSKSRVAVSLQGPKPTICDCRLPGTTKVMLCYKAFFSEIQHP